MAAIMTAGCTSNEHAAGSQGLSRHAASASASAKRPDTLRHRNLEIKRVPRVNYPPFVSEGQAKTLETAAVLADLSRLNKNLGSNVLTSFSATTEAGLPQFNYVVNQSRWDEVPDAAKEASVSKGGALFQETTQIYRKFHRGRVCLGNRENFLMLHVINERGVEVGLDYTVFVSHSECPRSALK